MTSREGRAELNFAWNRADVEGLGIGVADNEVDTGDALLKHRVDGIRAATTDANHFDGRVGRLGNVELHGESVCGWKGNQARSSVSNQFLTLCMNFWMPMLGKAKRSFSAAGVSVFLARMRSYPLMTSPTPVE